MKDPNVLKQGEVNLKNIIGLKFLGHCPDRFDREYQRKLIINNYLRKGGDINNIIYIHVFLYVSDKTAEIDPILNIAFEKKGEGLNTQYMINKKNRDENFIKNTNNKDEWGYEMIQHSVSERVKENTIKRNVHRKINNYYIQAHNLRQLNRERSLKLGKKRK